MTILFEHSDWQEVKDTKSIGHLLDNAWSDLLFSNDEFRQERSLTSRQQYVSLTEKALQSRNYIGFIETENDAIEIWPKVFRALGTEVSISDRQLMLDHLFYWFDYCRKWKFPVVRAGRASRHINTLPELIIHTIALQFFEVCSTYPLSMYHEQEERRLTPQGRINFSRTIKQQYSKGQFQVLECDTEPFVFDNRVNRVIKFCSRILLEVSKSSQNIRLLQDTVAMLDEVEDRAFTIRDLAQISLPAYFNLYSEVLENCALVLEQHTYTSRIDQTLQWCMLLPMEYVFEDFVAGFLERHFAHQWKVQYQKSELFLSSTPRAFQLQHDIVLTSKSDPNKIVIIDTKYKIRNWSTSDVKAGISQQDMYQVVSYALRRGCENVVLLYPNAGQITRIANSFEITSGFDNKHRINVLAVEIPFWSISGIREVESQMLDSLQKLLSIFVKSI